MVLVKTVLKNKKRTERSGTKSEMSINCVILRTLVHPFTVKSHTAFWEGVERKPFGYASFEMREDDLKSVRSIGCNIKKHSNTKSWRYVFDLICESLENTDSLGGKLSSKCINLVLFLSFVSHLFSTVGVILCKFSTRHRQKHMIWYITRLWSTNILSKILYRRRCRFNVRQSLRSIMTSRNSLQTGPTQLIILRRDLCICCHTFLTVPLLLKSFRTIRRHEALLT